MCLKILLISSCIILFISYLMAKFNLWHAQLKRGVSSLPKFILKSLSVGLFWNICKNLSSEFKFIAIWLFWVVFWTRSIATLWVKVIWFNSLLMLSISFSTVVRGVCVALFSWLDWWFLEEFSWWIMTLGIIVSSKFSSRIYSFYYSIIVFYNLPYPLA